MAKARKEIDKESMYQKIMPSAMRSAPPAEEEPPPAKTAAKKPPARSTPRKPPAKAAAAPESDEELLEEGGDRPEAEPAPARAPRKTLPARKPVLPSTTNDKPNILNIMELLIDEKIEVAMDKFHCCTCDKCRQDITAMALNKLHPKYIVAEPEELETAMADKEANTQVTTALVQAILKVKANPKH